MKNHEIEELNRLREEVSRLKQSNQNMDHLQIRLAELYSKVRASKPKPRIKVR